MRTLRFIHRWLGLLLAIPLLIQGLSGAVLTLEPVWPDFEPALATGGGTGAATANAILAAAAAAAPPGMRPARYIPAEPDGAARVVFAPEGNPRGPGMTLRLDPATAAPLGAAVPVSGVMEWIKHLHQNLLLPQFGGRQVWGWVGVGMLLLTVLGMPLWWPKPGQWAAAVTVPRKARGVRLHRALHGALGAWLVVMMLVVSVTGIAQGFPQTVRQVLGMPAGGPPRPGRPAPGAKAPMVDLDAAMRLARWALPGLDPRVVMLPAAAEEPVRLLLAPPGQEGAIATRIVTTDAAGTRVLSVPPPLPGNELVLRWVHDLHEATGLGPVWRALMVLTGVALPVFGFTGVALWLLKRRNRQRVAAVRALSLS